MKRLIILVIILAGLVAVCLGRYGTGDSLLKAVQLSTPRLTGSVSFEQALATRRSVRRFTGQPFNFVQIGQLAWAGQGITEPQKGFRTAPSAGAIYPIKLYFATDQGLFVYSPKGHRLEKTLEPDIRGALADQEMVAKAGCDIIIAGSQSKLAARFSNKAKEYMLLEAGHIAQNIQLLAVCLEWGSVVVGGFDANQVHKVCKLPKDLEPLLIISVGYPAGPDSDKNK